MNDHSIDPTVAETNSQAHPKKRYFNFLDQVIFRVVFTKELDHSEKLVKELHNHIQDIFPIPKEITHKIYEASVLPDKVSQTERTLRLPNFYDSTMRKQLYFEPLALVIRQSASTYTTFAEFYEMIKRGVEAFGQVYGNDIIISQTELRYVNNIKLSGDPFNWKGLIKKELLSVLDFPHDKNEISRAMNLVELTKEGCKLKMQSGIFNVDYPTPVAKREFILDYTCYSIEEREIKSAIGLADKFHTEIKSLFNDSVLEKLKSRMGEL